MKILNWPLEAYHCQNSSPGLGDYSPTPPLIERVAVLLCCYVIITKVIIMMIITIIITIIIVIVVIIITEIKII